MKKILLTLPVFLLQFACKDDLKLNAPYKEVPIIYAVIDASEKIHMIRINKVFLGEGDANVMAKVADSVNYKADELSVTLTHNTGKTYSFRDSVVQTVAGAFSTTQRIYVNSSPMETSGIFKLTVKNNHTGNVFTATASPLPPMAESGYPPFAPPYYPVNKSTYNPYVDFGAYVDYSKTGTVRFSTYNQAKIYNLVVRFHFFDTIETLPRSIYHYVDYNFQNQYLNQSQSGIMVATFKAADIYTALRIGLKRMNLNKNVTGRIFFKTQYLVYASTQEYFDFLEFSKPALSINTQKPLYSNFDGKTAYGIFTFKSVLSVEKELFYPYVTALAENFCKDSLYFLTPSGTPPVCK
jgi:hypothetical protein